MKTIGRSAEYESQLPCLLDVSLLTGTYQLSIPFLTALIAAAGFVSVRKIGASSTVAPQYDLVAATSICARVPRAGLLR